MACCRKAPARPSAQSFEWEIVPQPDMDALTVVTCLDETALDAARAELQSLCVALAECPPLRVRLVRHRLGDIVMLNVNHAAGDAFGAVRFLRSIARAYAGEADPRPDIDLTASRDLRSLLLARDVHTRLGRLLLLLQKTSDLVTVPARVAKHGGVDRPGYGIHQVRLSLEQTQALNSLGDGARVNNVLVAALHVAIALWNIEHGVRCGRISVLMPVNLRPAHLRAEMVGNFSLMVRVLTTPEQRSLGRVVLTVTDQVQRMKNGDTLAALIELLARTASLPIWAKRVAPAVLAITGNRLVDTAQLANLGVVDELPSFGRDAGDTRELWYSPPARMPLGLSVGAVEAAGRLHLAFCYRHPLLSPDGACRLADYYLSVLDQLVAWHTPKVRPEVSGPSL